MWRSSRVRRRNGMARDPSTAPLAVAGRAGMMRLRLGSRRHWVMKVRGSSLALVAALPLLLGIAPGCKKDEPPKPDPAAEAATANASARVAPKHNARSGFNRPDPQVTKD